MVIDLGDHFKKKDETTILLKLQEALNHLKKVSKEHAERLMHMNRENAELTDKIKRLERVADASRSIPIQLQPIELRSALQDLMPITQ